MNAAEVLRAARAAGVQLGVDGDDLVLKAPGPPPSDVIQSPVTSQVRAS